MRIGDHLKHKVNYGELDARLLVVFVVGCKESVAMSVTLWDSLTAGPYLLALDAVLGEDDIVVLWAPDYFDVPADLGYTVCRVYTASVAATLRLLGSDRVFTVGFSAAGDNFIDLLDSYKSWLGFCERTAQSQDLKDTF